MMNTGRSKGYHSESYELFTERRKGKQHGEVEKKMYGHIQMIFKSLIPMAIGTEILIQ